MPVILILIFTHNPSSQPPSYSLPKYISSPAILFCILQCLKSSTTPTNPSNIYNCYFPSSLNSSFPAPHTIFQTAPPTSTLLNLRDQLDTPTIPHILSLCSPSTKTICPSQHLLLHSPFPQQCWWFEKKKKHPIYTEKWLVLRTASSYRIKSSQNREWRHEGTSTSY